MRVTQPLPYFSVKQDMGKAMSLEMSELKGKAEAGLISNVVKAFLQYKEFQVPHYVKLFGKYSGNQIYGPHPNSLVLLWNRMIYFTLFLTPTTAQIVLSKDPPEQVHYNP